MVNADKLLVDHQLNKAQRQFVGLGIAHCSAAFYVICYVLFYVVMNRITEDKTGTGYLSAIHVGFGLWYLILGAMALSVTGKNPPLCPIQCGHGLSIITLKIVVGACIVTGIDLNWMATSEGGGYGFLTMNKLFEVCPKGVFMAASYLLMFFHVAEFLLVCTQILAVSQLKVSWRTQIAYTQRLGTMNAGQFASSQRAGATNPRGIPRAHGRPSQQQRLGSLQRSVPPNCEIIGVSTTSTVRFD